jgi:SagB-type dehydrogenase family enzyme
MSDTIHLRFADGALLDEQDQELVFRQGGRTVRVASSPTTRAALRASAARPLSLSDLARRAQADGPLGPLRARDLAARLVAAGLAVLEVRQPFDGVLARARARAAGHRLALSAVDRDALFALSRFAYLRRDGWALVVESPRSALAVVLEDPRALSVVQALAQPRSLAEVTGASTGLGPGSVVALITLLWWAGLLTTAEAGRTAEDTDPGLACWEFHDLLFHARSRLGRHGAAYGATYRFGGADPLPAVVRRPDSERIALPVPDHSRLLVEDEPFTRVLERRCSVRRHGAAPTLAQVGEFLYRSARVMARRCVDGEELTTRPYPGGGARYELEVYLAVEKCDDLERGLYHYDPLEHGLERVAPPSADFQALLAGATAAMAETQPPQILVVLAARFGRMTWKYESIAYAAILKNVGALLQTMYLVATAMGLAPCAVGTGDSDAFARLAGTRYEAETSVGELALGTLPETNGAVT